MSKPEQINELIKRELADAISKESCLENGLITISFVECSPDFNFAKVGISVLPHNLAGTALRSLRQKTGIFAQALRKNTRLRRIPRFQWEIDDTESRASVIEKLIEQIKENN